MPSRNNRLTLTDWLVLWPFVAALMVAALLEHISNKGKGGEDGDNL